MQAGINTANAVKPMQEVMNHAHTRQRQAHQAHALAAHVERGGDEVQRAQQLSDAEDTDGNRPQHLAGSLSRTGHRTQRAQRSVSRPAGERRSLGNEEGRHRPRQNATNVTQNDIMLMCGNGMSSAPT